MEIDDSIVLKIRPYKAIDAIAKTAALLLVPELSASTIRIEHLLNLIVKNARGKKNFNRGVLHQLLNIKLSDTPWARLEDPPEDLFSGNIALLNGNYLMLEGNWEQNIATTQMVLDALQYLAIENSEYIIIHKTVCDILKISNTILSESGISAYISPAGVDRAELSLPDNDTITNLSYALLFDTDKLKKLDISEKSLDLFVLQDLTSIDGTTLAETPLHRYPIIKIDSKYIVIPSFLGFAIRKFVLSSIENKNLLKGYGEILFDQQVHKTFRFIKEPMICDIEISLPDDLKNKIKDHIYRIDVDKVAQIIFIADTLENKADKDWAAYETFPASLIDYMKKCSEKLSEKYQDGVIILILGSIGGGTSFRTNERFANFKLASFSIQDFELLLHHKDFSLLKFWKCKHEDDILFDKGTHIVNPSGDMNLYAFWLANNYSLVPHENGKTVNYDKIAIPTNCLFDMRKYIKPLMNLHSAKNMNDEYIVVQRKDINSYFKSYNENRIYIAIHYFFSRILLYLVEGNYCKFWLHFTEIESAKSYQYFEITHKIFDLISFWLEKGLEQIENIVCNKKPYIFHIDVSFSNFDKYTLENIENMQDNNQPVQLNYNLNGFMFIVVDFAFIKRMYLPENAAEKELTAMIINAVNSIVNHKKQIDKIDIWAITRNIFGYSKYSRQLHFFKDANIEDVLSVTKNDIILLAQEEILSIENDLDFSIATLDKKSILNKLNYLVNILYSDLIKRLVIFDKKYLIVIALENNEKIMMESTRWKRTAAAVIASHDNSGEARNTIKEQISMYAKGSQASRILSEIALCHCSDNGKKASIVEIEYLLAEVYKIFEFGRISDALYYDLVGIDMFGLEKGMLFFKDNSSIDTIMDKYQNTIASHDLEQNIKTYDKLYKNRNSQKQNKPEDNLLESFAKAYKKEFGFSYELPLQISFLLAQVASDRNEPHLDLSYDEIIDIIKNSPIQFESIDELKGCIDYFTLNARNQFEENKESKYFRNNNIWLYKRPLSPLFKPFIKISTKQYLLFPRLVCRANEYFFDLCYHGELDHKLFGKEMLTYIGHRRNEVGRTFNDRVADWFLDKKYKVESNLQMRTIGVKRNDIDLGDIDVFAFDEERNIAYIIECKNLERALTPKDMGQQIKRFLKGNERWLSRHIARYKWVMDNKVSVIEKMKIGNSDTKLIPILLVNDIIPIQFMNTLDYPIENIITMSDLKDGFIYKARDNYYPLYTKDN